ncbi:Enamine deaminase RidA, house cleaning of reactive enamine intermediates, YjgF/YER057c/UK114 family [Halomicrobium zhouii]|uniref:Enamine deaminase RidA, house cleaning of reactive enamine intermediates, YjgF/YER057c/UK114 family n=1 Tax=Halomicrobium zhouii TaxID=767519 RepID=A0A1I6L649_9EURY|nr:Enamine deaminase RidA, house cleaning of reactive enamine intermediates, YjgF/YER057c/UK114 family [Halomicrobium zhouii]
MSRPDTPPNVTRQTVSSGTQWEEEVGYSRAVRVGDRIEVSGTTATDEAGEIVGIGDPYAQASQAIENIESALADVDAALTDVVRTRMFVTDVDHYDAVGRAHGEAFGEIRPATSMYEVSALVEPELLVEIEATAIVAD